MSEILISTMNDVPGYEVTEVHGEAKGYTKLLTDSRLHAQERLVEAAREKGANAVIAMRFDCNEIGDIMSEVAAYGTAVTIRPTSAP